MNRGPDVSYVSDFLSTRHGVALAEAFMAIKGQKLRRSVVQLIDEIARTID